MAGFGFDGRRREKKRIEREFAEITADFDDEDIPGIDFGFGPRDYRLAEDDSTFVQPDPEPVGKLGFWVLATVIDLAVLIIIAVYALTKTGNIPQSLVMLIPVLAGFLILSLLMAARKNPRPPGDDGAQV